MDMKYKKILIEYVFLSPLKMRKLYLWVKEKYLSWDALKQFHMIYAFDLLALFSKQNSPSNMSMSNQPGTPRDDGEMGGNFLNPFQSESVSTVFFILVVLLGVQLYLIILGVAMYNNTSELLHPQQVKGCMFNQVLNISFDIC